MIDKNLVLEAVMSIYGNTRNSVICTYDDLSKYSNTYVDNKTIHTIIGCFVADTRRYFDILDDEDDYHTAHTDDDITLDRFQDWVKSMQFDNCLKILELSI